MIIQPSIRLCVIRIQKISGDSGFSRMRGYAYAGGYPAKLLLKQSKPGLFLFRKLTGSSAQAAVIVMESVAVLKLSNCSMNIRQQPRNKFVLIFVSE